MPFLIQLFGELKCSTNTFDKAECNQTLSQNEQALYLWKYQMLTILELYSNFMFL